MEPSERSAGDPQTIEDCEQLLASKGWRMSSTVCLQNGSTFYRVTCYRHKDWIDGQGATQLEAWQDAVAKAVAEDN